MFLILLLLAFVPLVINLPAALAQSSNDDLNQKLQDNQNQINQLQSQIADAQKQEKTLGSQLTIINGQMKVTELKINQTNLEIEKLNREIKDLSGRIDRLSGTVDSISGVLLNRIVQTYKYGQADVVDLLFSSTDLSQTLERFRYIQIAQANDKKVLYQLQATKAAYHDQKQDKQTRQTEAEKLSKQLADYQKDLDRQKVAKAELLRVTQNNEAVYQQKLQAAIAEQNAILSILSGGGNEVKVGLVHKGDTIGNVIAGKSACSSGTHLHFEVHQNNSLVNPAGTLSGHSVTWDDNLDSPVSFSGSWDWPITDPIYIEQPFGNTWYAQHGWYTNPPGHTGVDMFTPSTLTVKAVHDGTLSTGGIACGGGTLHYKKIDHGDGYSSYYLHMY